MRNGSNRGIAHKNVICCFCPVLTSLLVPSVTILVHFRVKSQLKADFEPEWFLVGHD